MTQYEFFSQIQITTNPVTDLPELGVVFDPGVPDNPTPVINEKDFFDRIKLIDGKIVIKLYNANSQ
jgi:hypothetical protein